MWSSRCVWRSLMRIARESSIKILRVLSWACRLLSLFTGETVNQLLAHLLSTLMWFVILRKCFKLIINAMVTWSLCDSWRAYIAMDLQVPSVVSKPRGDRSIGVILTGSVGFSSISMFTNLDVELGASWFLSRLARFMPHDVSCQVPSPTQQHGRKYSLLLPRKCRSMTMHTVELWECCAQLRWRMSAWNETPQTWTASFLCPWRACSLPTRIAVQSCVFTLFDMILSHSSHFIAENKHRDDAVSVGS